MSKYEFTSRMREISGMGGVYEEGCRKMVIAGMKWMDKHPEAKPKFMYSDTVIGIITTENISAEKLSKAVDAAAKGCSGDMNQKVIEHLMHIKKVGWDTYVEEMGG